MTTTTHKQWNESATGCESIDREAGIIRGVKIIGLVSSNGRKYKQEAIDQALPIYDNSKVNLNHAKGERGMSEFWGVLRNPRSVSEGGARADLHYIKSHPMTAMILEAAERFPDKFGLSHVAIGDEEDTPDGPVVTSIDDVISVDVVSSPATNRGLFESERRTMKTTVGKLLEQLEAKAPFAKKLREEMTVNAEDMGYDPMAVPMDMPAATDDPVAQVDAAFRAIMISVLDDSSLDTAGKLSKLKDLFKAKDSAASAVAGPSAAADAGSADGSTAESSEVAKLKAQVAKLRESNERLECKTMLTESGREAKPICIEALMATAPDKRKALLESWPVKAAAPEADDADDEQDDYSYGDRRAESQSRRERPRYSPAAIQESQGGEFPDDYETFKKQLRS